MTELMMANEEDAEEDVVIEGSDLYNILKQMGCPDFECTSVNRTKLPDNWEEFGNSKYQTHTPRYPGLLTTYQTIRNYFYSYETHRKFLNGVKELEIILQLEPLLDDHSMMIQNILKDYTDLKTNTSTCSLRLLSTALLLAASLLSNKSRIPGLIIAASFSTLTIYQKYSSSFSLQQLRNLVSTQNKLFHLQRKSLRILRKSRKFSDLEVNKFKYLQPLCENLCKSIEKCSRMFYKTSYTLTDLLPPSVKSPDLITKFENESFEIQGEITYKRLEKFYYTYILAQSDMMNLLAIIYSNDSKNHTTPFKLSQIINHLYRNLKIHEEKLNFVIEQYQSSKTLEIPRRSREINAPKYRDLYMHVDLLSRKLQTAYKTISSILEDIDNYSNEETEDLIDSLVFKMNETYKQIDTARDFAEFNILVMKKLQSNRKPQQVALNCISNLVEREEQKVIFDADPQVMDECFEEYIREEYLKPLCKDDDDSLERAKMDKLLEKNFMSELKGVLVDKYRSMSEREAQALLRYRKSSGHGVVDEVMRIPLPPPLPINQHSSVIEVRNRGPVPLPRTVNIAVIHDEEQSVEIAEPEERFSIKMAIGGRIPAFTRDEETFVGSGENSEDELAGSDCEEDEVA